MFPIEEISHFPIGKLLHFPIRGIPHFPIREIPNFPIWGTHNFSRSAKRRDWRNRRSRTFLSVWKLRSGKEKKKLGNVLRIP